MAKTIKGIQTANEFSLRKKEYLDDRQSFDTIADMAGFDDVPDGFITLNKEDGKRYEYNSSNLMDATLGKWKEYKIAEIATNVPNWVPNTDYVVNDIVMNGDKKYQAIKAHLSSTDFDMDKDNWIELSETYALLTVAQYEYLKTNNLLENKLYIKIDDDTSGSGSSGTNDYDDLLNRPQINNKTIEGIKNGTYYGLIDKVDFDKIVGDINALTVVGVHDVISALNKLDLSFMQSIVYNTKDGKKLLTITYKNGNTTDIDVSAIITGTNIGELANVDDSGITDKQLLGYDSSTGKYIPMTIDNSKVLQDAKDYTDKQINTINHVEGKVVDSKPTIVNNGDGTYSITYIKNGVSTTTTDTNIWFFYNTGTNTYAQTIFIDGVEVTLSMNGSIDLTDYVNKTTDLASGFTGSEIDKTKVTTIKELDDLFALINTTLGNKVNVSDVIDDLQHTNTDKPLSANQGRELNKKIDAVVNGIGGSILIKKQFNNVTGGVENKFDSPVSLKGGYVSAVYSVKSGSTNLSGTLKEFKNNTKQDFIKNEDEIIIDDNGGKIKDEYKIIPIENNSLFVYDINDIDAENIVLESD